MNKHKIMIHQNCVGCSQCIKDCPTHNIKLTNGKAQMISQDCIFCGHCEAICPKSAIMISGYESEPIHQSTLPVLDPHQIVEVIRFRRTIRQFKKQDIPASVMNQILEAGRLTHTSKNAQDVSFVVLDQKIQEIEAIAVRLLRRIKPMINCFSALARRNEITDDFFFFQAPKVIIISANDAINAHLAAQNMEFVAEANGLGVLFSGYFTMVLKMSHKLRKMLGLKRKQVAVTLVLGYPKVTYRRSPRREPLKVKVY